MLQFLSLFVSQLQYMSFCPNAAGELFHQHALIGLDSVGLFYYLQALPPGSWSSTLVWLLQSGEGFHFESHDPT